MSDKGIITVGLVVFLGLVTFPIWYGLAGDEGAQRPDLELPKDASSCVEDTDYMIAHHTDLLNQWRDAVVREGQKEYTSKAFGTQFEMSLTRTCLRCHAEKEAFCDRCHTYAGAEPTCWNCHVEPRGN